MTNPIRPTDDEARGTARDVLQAARTAALAVLDDTGAPVLSRIGFGLDPQGQALTLVSDLSQHTQLMRAGGPVSLLVGAPGARGDPLNHPRLTVQALPAFVPRGGEEHAALANAWCETHPKAKLYVGFGDFGFVRFQANAGFLNGGFGKAFHLTPADMGLGTA